MKPTIACGILSWRSVPTALAIAAVMPADPASAQYRAVSDAGALSAAVHLDRCLDDTGQLQPARRTFVGYRLIAHGGHDHSFRLEPWSSINRAAQADEEGITIPADGETAVRGQFVVQLIAGREDGIYEPDDVLPLLLNREVEYYEYFPACTDGNAHRDRPEDYPTFIIDTSADSLPGLVESLRQSEEIAFSGPLSFLVGETDPEPAQPLIFGDFVAWGLETFDRRQIDGSDEDQTAQDAVEEASAAEDPSRLARLSIDGVRNIRRYADIEVTFDPGAIIGSSAVFLSGLNDWPDLATGDDRASVRYQAAYRANWQPVDGFRAELLFAPIISDMCLDEDGDLTPLADPAGEAAELLGYRFSLGSDMQQGVRTNSWANATSIDVGVPMRDTEGSAYVWSSLVLELGYAAPSLPWPVATTRQPDELNVADAADVDVAWLRLALVDSPSLAGAYGPDAAGAHPSAVYLPVCTAAGPAASAHAAMAANPAQLPSLSLLAETPGHARALAAFLRRSGGVLTGIALSELDTVPERLTYRSLVPALFDADWSATAGWPYPANVAIASAPIGDREVATLGRVVPAPIRDAETSDAPTEPVALIDEELRLLLPERWSEVDLADILSIADNKCDGAIRRLPGSDRDYAVRCTSPPPFELTFARLLPVVVDSWSFVVDESRLIVETTVNLVGPWPETRFPDRSPALADVSLSSLIDDGVRYAMFDGGNNEALCSVVYRPTPQALMMDDRIDIMAPCREIAVCDPSEPQPGCAVLDDRDGASPRLFLFGAR